MFSMFLCFSKCWALCVIESTRQIVVGIVADYPGPRDINKNNSATPGVFRVSAYASTVSS